MLKEIMLNFEEIGGQCDVNEYLRVLKFVPVYQEIPKDLQDPF
jgi:hypothetical protein